MQAQPNDEEVVCISIEGKEVGEESRQCQLRLLFSLQQLLQQRVLLGL